MKVFSSKLKFLQHDIINCHLATTGMCNKSSSFNSAKRVLVTGLSSLLAHKSGVERENNRKNGDRQD
jgi:hypothetical protein